ncbi:MAG: Magnesium and cobalt efflux protein CorC [Labilithrix sp.]|nr:Magnesium and cobalt efflux protein CorC [Labilithrix sp.]
MPSPSIALCIVCGAWSTSTYEGTEFATRCGVIALIACVVLLGVNAFFVAAEFALVKVRIAQLEPAVAHGDRRAAAAKAVLARLDRYLSVTQFGITVASLGLGWIGEPALEHLGDEAAIFVSGRPLGQLGHGVVDALGLGLLTFFHLLLGELVPKFVAIQHPVWTSLNAAIPLLLVNRVFSPVLWVLEKAQRGVLRALRVDPNVASGAALSEDEIVGILADAAARDPRGRDKKRIIERFLRFSNRPVKRMMVPRVDVVFMPIDTPGPEAYELLRNNEFSRVLLVGDSIDDVVGYLYAKDFLFDEDARSRPTLRGLERHILFVPESRDGLSVMREMQREAIPLAAVVDEYGGTSGIVTLEDLVEEFVGQIRDELDVETEDVVPVSGHVKTWDVDASATIDELSEVGIPIDEEWRGELVGTVITKLLGHLPRLGDSVRIADGVVAEVVTTTRRRLLRVRFRMA